MSDIIELLFDYHLKTILTLGLGASVSVSVSVLYNKTPVSVSPSVSPSVRPSVLTVMLPW